MNFLMHDNRIKRMIPKTTQKAMVPFDKTFCSKISSLSRVTLVAWACDLMISVWFIVDFRSLSIMVKLAASPKVSPFMYRKSS